MGKLQRLELDNFKSYRGRHIIGPFEQFTCIIGPNGSGKSNLMDAISFVLAISAKFLRSQNLQELVYHNDDTDKSAGTCSVSLFYVTDEIDNDLNENVKPGQEIEFFRRVNANGTSQFKVNGRQITSEAYIKKLAEFNILVNCRNFIVYQGDVQNISTRSPEELTILFEQISGSYELKGEYERLGDKREKLKAVMDMNLKKKYTMISEKKVVQEQKEEADDYQKKQSLLRDLRVEYFLWQLYNIESNLELHNQKTESLKEKYSQMEKQDSTYRQQKESKQREMAKYREKQRKLEKQQRVCEDRIKQKQPENLKSIDRMRRYNQEKNHYIEEIDHVKKEIDSLQKDSELLEIEIDRMKITLDALINSLPQIQQGIILSIEQKEQYSFLKEQFMNDAGSIVQLSDQKRREYDSLTAQIKQKNELIISHQQELDKTRKLVESLRSQQNRLEQSKTDVEKVIKQLENESHSLQTEYSSLTDSLQQKRIQLETIRQSLQGDIDIKEGKKREKERKSCVMRLQELFPEVRGLLLDLCNPIQKKYALAIETALGKHLDAIIVNTKSVAIECIQYLKEQHMLAMDFYPLDSLQARELRIELRQYNCHLCYELIEFDSIIEIAIRYAVGNTVVTDTLTTARRLAYHEKINEKIVTMEGEEIAKNGAMTGGVGYNVKGNKFHDKVIQKKKEEIDCLEEECIEIEKKLNRFSRNSEKVRSLESDILSQKGKLRVFNEELEIMKRKMESYGERMSVLETTIYEEKQEEDILKKQEEIIVNELSILRQRITIMEKRIYGSFLIELNMSSIQQLEQEYLTKIHENELIQSECRTHITLIESKQEYSIERMKEMRKRENNIERLIEKNEIKMKEIKYKVETVENEMKMNEEENDGLKGKLGKLLKDMKDIEIIIQEIDKKIRDNRGNLKKSEDQISNERCSTETLRSKRNAVLKSAMMEQVQIPFLSSTESQVSALSADGDDSRMEIEDESGSFSQSLTQQFSQSQAITVQTDQEQIDHIDFSILGENSIVVNENDYIQRDEQYRDRVSKLSSEVDKMAPNMLAEQKYRDITDRVGVINADRKELVTEYNTSNDEFKDCCERRKQLFMNAYQQVEMVIDSTYKDLTRSIQFSTGGQALLALTNPEDPYLGGVKYTVSPVGKQYRDISQLSGGEKTIATLALLFSLHSYRRAPFFIMDEVDDALDNANVERVAKFMEQNSKGTQCVIISHKDLLFEKSESLVGIYHNWKEASSSILTIDLRKYSPISGDNGQ